MTGELDGVVVLDATDDISGAYTSRLLHGAGATVTALEPPGGARLRRWSWDRDLEPGDDGALFCYLRQGHRSVVGRRGDPVVAELLAGADIVVVSGSEPFGPPAELAAANPGLIVVAITPYGLDGPDADRPATEFTVQADSGAIAIRGTADRPPIQLGVRIIEWVAGAYAGVAALAARRRQAATGDGDLIDVSLCEVAHLSATNFTGMSYAMQGRPPIERPARTVEIPSIEPTADGWVGFNTNSRQQFESFCIMIERPDMAIDDDWAKLQYRSARADEWNAIVRDWTTKHTTAEVVELAAELRVPVAPVADGPAVIELDHVIARGVMQPDPSGDFVAPRRPWQIHGDPIPDPAPAPALGAHQDEPVPQHRRRAPSGDRRLPLDGQLVVDLTAWWAGPSATGVLAALGATVIHVESTGRPDGMRMAGGMFIDRPAWWERSSFFLQANTNKRGITLDLDTPAGRDLLLRLIDRADLVVENFTPRVLEAFNLGWDVVHARNPRTVMVRMPAFGLDGPWRDRPGFAQTMEQVTGLAWLTGHADDQPRIQRGPCDPNGGLHAAFSALVGLARRDRTGEGCLVEAPMFEAALAVAAEPVLEWSAYRNRIGRDGNRGPAAAPQGLYPTAVDEEWLALAVASDEQWQAFCTVIDRPDLAADPALADRMGRRGAHDRIDDAVAAWAAPLQVADAVAQLNAAGIPAAAANDPRLTATLPQLVARGYFEDVDHPVAGVLPTPGLPFRMGVTDRWIRVPAPTLGQHNDEVLGEWLGCSAEELAELTAARVIGTRPRGL